MNITTSACRWRISPMIASDETRRICPASAFAPFDTMTAHSNCRSSPDMVISDIDGVCHWSCSSCSNCVLQNYEWLTFPLQHSPSRCETCSWLAPQMISDFDHAMGSGRTKSQASQAGLDFSASYRPHRYSRLRNHRRPRRCHPWQRYFCCLNNESVIIFNIHHRSLKFIIHHQSSNYRFDVNAVNLRSAARLQRRPDFVDVIRHLTSDIRYEIAPVMISLNFKVWM